MAIDLCLPVVKFSHVDNLDSSGKGQWNHVQNSDLFVVLQGHGMRGPMTMKIVVGTSNLEVIDIGTYVDTALNARRAAEQRGLTDVPTDHLPIFGMTKEAALALRYRLFDADVTRRIQLKLQNVHDCQRLTVALRSRGMEFQSRPGTARPSTSSARPSTSSARPEISRPESSHTDFRPLSAQTSSSYFTADQSTRHSDPQHQSPAADTKPMRPPIKAPSLQDDEHLYGRSSRYQEGHLGRDGGESGLHGRERQAGPAEGDGARRVIAPDDALRDIVPSRLSNSQLWRSHTTHQVTNYQPQQAALEPMAERPSSASNTAALDAIRQAFEDRETSSNVGGDTRPSTAVVGQEQWLSGAANASTSSYMSSGPLEGRPQTAASGTSLTVPEHGAQPKDVQKDEVLRRPPTSSSSSRPSSSALELPPLKRPKMVKETSAPRAPDLYTQPTYIRPQTSKPQDNSVPQDRRPYTSASRLEDTKTLGRDSSSVARLLEPPPLHAPAQPDRRLSPTDGFLNRSMPLAERSNNVGLPRLTSNTDAPHEIESPPPSAYHPSNSAGQPVVAKDDALGRVSMALQPTGDPSLEKYAAQSRADREATLADFMIENLENPAFATLCEDVENCWQRIALGL
ncbi:hypothetical protein PRZ48_000333 [Zasmidium cellare]|uniref:Uncharacterized protein n=1 Tax=Zasmidium cellare TaxID=395010 RepID=A0ABR0EZS3_ZASCE|nr:hypothetical protein PRZ48_000333 [Zasmidium cellare]